MKIISVTNGKGGVGKTTLAVHAAYVLATRYDQRVLLADFDRQWQSTKYLGCQDTNGAGSFILSGKRLEDHLTVVHENLSLLTGSDMTGGGGVALSTGGTGGNYLRTLFDFYAEMFDVLIFDTAAHGYLNEMSIVAADLVAVPTPFRHMDADGVTVFASIWSSAPQAAGTQAPLVSVVPNMVDNRTSVTGDLREALVRSVAEGKIHGWEMAPAIPINTNFSRAFGEQRTIFEIARSPAVTAGCIAMMDVVAHLAGRLAIVLPN